MIEIAGNFFDVMNELKPDTIVCTINKVVYNGRLIMGAGIAKAFRDRFTGIDSRWGYQRLNKTEGLLFDWYEDITIVGLPTKKYYKNKSRIEFVDLHLRLLKEFVDYNDSKKVLMTRPGCGLGGLNWEDVKLLMADFDDRFIVCHKDYYA